MANYGSTYGSSVVYGPSGSGPSIISSLDVLSETEIQISFTNLVVVNDDLVNPENYNIEFADSPGLTDVQVRRVRVGVAGVPVDVTDLAQLRDVGTTLIELVTDKHTKGTTYKVSVSNLTSADGSSIATTSVKVVGRRTKVDTVLGKVPRHFDRRPESLIRTILTAIGIEDDRIGGSLNEEILITSEGSGGDPIEFP